MFGESELAMVSRHICAGDIVVSRQMEIVRRLRDGGRETKRAEELLTEFELIQAEHLAHFARLIGRPA